MEREQVNLAAIMFTDIVGYTSLTGSDEDLAFKLLDQHRRIVRPIIIAHNGKEVKTIGDAFLVEFGSAVEATQCAYDIQEALYNFNSARRRSEKITLRIGIHLGDVIHSNDDVYGDAVNVGSRIEKLSEPGGICISRQVYDSVRGKMHDLKFESLGVQQMKNVKNEVEVFKVEMPWDITSSLEYRKESEEGQPKNRIAVLPFVNIGSEKSDEFFADGLTEELISRLSQTKDLRVIARTSAMNYKNVREKKVRDIARELGVGTIVEGSVRKAGNKIRVSVQAVNGVNEEHIWSSTYDRNLDDIFEIQSDIATKVSESFSSNFSGTTQKQIQASWEKEETQNVTAYTYFLRARNLLYGESESSVRQALELFRRAIEEDPNFARAYVGRAQSYQSLSYFGHEPWLESVRKAEADAKKALELDPYLAEAHATMAHVHFALDEFGPAEEEAKKAVELNPSLADAYDALGHLEWIKGHLKEATKLYETAHKLDPLKEEFVGMLDEMYFEAGREADALKLLSDVEHLFPQMVYASLTAYYSTKHDFLKAREFLEKFRLAGGDQLVVSNLESLIAAYAGEKEKALEIVSRLEKNSPKDTIQPWFLGGIYNALGDMDKFFECMNLAMDEHAVPLGNLVNSPLYEKARKDPRMQKLLERFDLKVDLPQ